MTERWAVVARDPRYHVSDQGRVRGAKGSILRPGRMLGGHVSVAIGKGNSVCVHELVIEAFGPRKPFPAAEVRHRDGDPAHNVWTNLVWGSRGDNTRDRKHHAGAKGRLTIDEVREIKRMIARNVPGVEIAAWFGVGSSSISAIKHGHNHPEVEA